MSKGFSINDILGSTKANAPAGQKMQVVMLPAADIEPNPENSIYEIGDVSMLKADIAERGLRSPLEVLPARAGKYKDFYGDKMQPPLTMHQREVWAKMNDEIGRLLGGYLKTLKQ